MIFQTAMVILLLASQWTIPLQHPKERSAVSSSELNDVLEETHRTVFGYKPSTARLAMALAHTRLEGSGSFCHNVGSIGASDKQPYCRVGPSHFRWFATHAEGALAYWSHLRDHCAGALQWFDAGDPEGTAAALRRCGYYRANEEWYASNLHRLYY